MASVRRIPSRPSPEFDVWLAPSEEAALLALPGALQSALTDPGASRKIIDRLFPPAYPGDPEEEAAHRRLLGSSLFEERRSDLDEFRRTFDRRERRRRNLRTFSVIPLSAQEMRLWIHVINDFRILLGTQLDIRDNEWRSRLPDSPEETASFLHLVRLSEVQHDLLAGFDGIG